MKKREQIIVLIAILALSYGVFDYFILSSDQNKNHEKIPAQTANQISGLLSKIDNSLITLKIISQKKTDADYWISSIESEWENDRFFKLEKLSDKTQKSISEIEIPDLIYSGFIKLGNKILAVIDGMEYTTGEYIKEFGYKIIQITPKKVVINIDTDKQIVLYLKEE